MHKLLEAYIKFEQFIFDNNQKVYDWLHNTFNLYVGTYRAIFLVLGSSMILSERYEDYMLVHKLNTAIVLGVLLAGSIYLLKRHVVDDCTLQKRGRYLQLNMSAINELNNNRWQRYYMIALFLFGMVMDGNKCLNLNNIGFFILTFYMYSLATMVRPRITKKKEYKATNLATNFG